MDAIYSGLRIVDGWEDDVFVWSEGKKENQHCDLADMGMSSSEADDRDDICLYADNHIEAAETAAKALAWGLVVRWPLATIDTPDADDDIGYQCAMSVAEYLADYHKLAQAPVWAEALPQLRRINEGYKTNYSARLLDLEDVIESLRCGDWESALQCFEEFRSWIENTAQRPAGALLAYWSAYRVLAGFPGFRCGAPVRFRDTYKFWFTNKGDKR